MSVQMYLVQPKNLEDDSVREDLAGFIAQRGGFILMATSYGSLIAAFDEKYLDAVKQHYLVEFASGVNLDLNAPGAAALRQVFAQNVAAQLVERGITQPDQPLAGQPPNPQASSFPPGYRPLRRNTRNYWEENQEGGE